MAQPTNDQLTIAYMKALHFKSKINTLRKLRNNRTTWCGDEDMYLRELIDNFLKEHDANNP